MAALSGFMFVKAVKLKYEITTDNKRHTGTL